MPKYEEMAGFINDDMAAVLLADASENGYGLHCKEESLMAVRVKEVNQVTQVPDAQKTQAGDGSFKFTHGNDGISQHRHR